MVAHAESARNPIEAGTVQWKRDLDGALRESKSTGRPVFVLFQEIPGCAGCQAFGQNVLTNPLLVEAIEDEFIPLLVYNNRAGGEDERLLKRFKEPSWNYQVVRFLNAEGRDIIPRKDRVWSLDGIASRAVAALRAAKRQAPKYLEALAMESDTRNHGSCAFAMSCFWTGERRLGQIQEVITTEAGWLDGREVTRVVYAKNSITLKELAKKAAMARCADKVYAPGNEQLDSGYRKARESDQKKQIARWNALRNVAGLTPMQLTKINAFAASGQAEALKWLSPRQRSILTSPSTQRRP